MIVLGNRAVIYLLSQRITTSKYFYQTPIANIDKNIAKEFLKWLEKKEPQIIVCYTQKPTKGNETYYTEKLFKYLDKAVREKKYKTNKELVKKVTIYEKIK